MIFTKKIIKRGTIKWEKKFAFLPVTIKEDYEKEVETTVWLQFYEKKYRYAGKYVGWMSENQYRLTNQ